MFTDSEIPTTPKRKERLISYFLCCGIVSKSHLQILHCVRQSWILIYYKGVATICLLIFCIKKMTDTANAYSLYSSRSGVRQNSNMLAKKLWWRTLFKGNKIKSPATFMNTVFNVKNYTFCEEDNFSLGISKFSTLITYLKWKTFAINQ